MSKSSFLLLSVAFLAAAASLQSGGARWGKVSEDLQWEARADFAALQDDMREIRSQAERAPDSLRSLWEDTRRDIRTLGVDLRVDARIAAKRLSSLIKTT